MKEFSVRFLREEEYETWDRLVDQSPYGTVFHRSEWCRALYQLDPGVALQIAGCFSGERLVGGLITGSRRKWKVFHLMVPPYASPFNGLVIEERETKQSGKAENHRREIFSSILSFLERHFDLGFFALHPDIRDIRSFIWNNNKVEVLYTYRSRLPDPADLFNQFLPALRRQIKKGEQLPYEILEAETDAEISEVHDLILSSYARQGHLFRFSREQFVTFSKNPFIRELLKCYVIRWEGKLVSALVILMDGTTAYYWLAGGNHHYFNTGLNQVLLWQVFQRLIASGCEMFDFVGANTPSISVYKSGFNFDLVPYYRISFESGWPIRAAMAVKKMVKKT